MSKKLQFVNYGKDTDVSTSNYNFLQSCIADAVEAYLKSSKDDTLDVEILYGISKDDSPRCRRGNSREEPSYEEDMARRQLQFKAESPDYPDILVLPEKTKTAIEDAVNLFKHYGLIFNTWNFNSVCPFASVALNFYGSPGTGKTLAAHVFCQRIGKKIIVANYARIASMYVGEGSKNLEALFSAAESQDAVLFLDEADSLLSKRIQGETNGAEAGINAMRGQLLICLEKFRGVVIFASNLIKNYDKAFETRIVSIEFPMPDKPARKLIWEKHLPKEFPLDATASFDKLSEIEDVCGRDIRNATLSVARKMANRNIPAATLELFTDAVEIIKKSRFDNLGQSNKFTKEESKIIGETIKKRRELKKSENDSFELLKEALDVLITARFEQNESVKNKAEAVQIAEEKTDAKKRFQKAAVQIAQKVLYADGIVDEKEAAFLEELGKTFGLKPQNWDELKDVPLAEICEPIVEKEQKDQLLEIACRMAAVDNQIPDCEIALIKEIYLTLGYDSEQFDRIGKFLENLVVCNTVWKNIVDK